MKLPRHLILSLAAVIVLMTGSRELLAQQQAAPLFTERFSNVFDPSSRTYFSLQGTEGKQFGGQQPFASIGATHYMGEIDSAVTLYSGQFMMNYNAITGNPAGSLGVQQRWLTDLPVLERSILGAGLYVDFTQSRYNNLFQQVNVNLELFTESAWVARANAYLPVGQTQQYTGLQSIQGGAPGQLSVVGTAVGLGGINQQWMDVALMGSDLELGRKFFNYRTEVYGGYYNWNGPLAGFTNGVKGGVRSYLTNNLSGNVNVSHDQFFGTNVYGGLTYFFGGSGGNRPNSFENLMTLPAQRSQQVSIGNYVREVSTFKPLYDSITGDELHMYFVKENGLGAGTQANPSNVNSVLADTHFATGSAMVLLDANGNITSPIALNHDRQQIIGGGSTGTADVDFSLALGQAPGTSVVHLSNLGGRPVLAPTTGNAVTLTNQNTIQGFTIDGSGGLTNGISGNPGATDTIIRDMILQNIAGTGIKIQPSTNTTVDNVTFANNGVDLLLNAANSKVSNITSTGAINGSLNLGGSGGDITGTTLISNVNISGAGGFGGILLNNAQNGSVTNLTNVNISSGTGSGVTVTNSQTGSIYNLTNVDVMNVGGNGMSLQNSNGTLNVNGTSSITNAGTAALAINGGAINVQFDGGISQGVTGSAVAVTGNHTGTVNFGTGSTINTTLGDGLQFNGADGSYTFLGTTNMNGGDAGIDIINSNGSFVFTNPFINNTASGMGVKIVGGVGDSPVTTFNGLNISTISNQGFFVSKGGLTTVNGTATVNTQFGTAFESQGTALAAVFTDITSTQSPAAGININTSSGTFGVTGTTTISGAALSGINIMGSNGLTSTFQNIAISNVGTGALDNGVTLSTAGTVSILGGTINGTTGDGINSNNTNLTATGLNIGGTGTIAGDGIEVINTGTARTVNLSNNTIKANASGISTKDSGAARELLLTLDGNTLQSLNGGSLALNVTGNGTNSTIIRSMNGGTVIGGAGGGVNFNRVTFDASGTALSGTQVNAGNWTIGTTGARVQGDGLRFDAPTGDLKYGTLNVANNSGTGLYVNTKTLGTTFALSNSSGSVNTTGGAALFLDPLTTNLTFGTVSSTNSTTNGATIDTVTGNLNINQFTVSGADGSGLMIQNSSGLTSIIQNLAISTVGTTGSDNGVTLTNAGNVSLLVGSIQGTTGDGIHSTDTNLTISGLGITGGSIAGDALQVVNTTGSHTVNVSNSALYGGTSALTTSDAGGAGGLILSLDNNNYISTGVGSVALNVNGSGLNSTIIKSMNSGTVFSGGSANFNRVTFDASGAALTGTQVNAGNWTFGGTTRLNGDGLNLTSTTGDLQFGNLIINNDGGTGLLVDTKTLGTTFTLGSTGGSIDTVNGPAMSLDPLTTNLIFQSVTSVNSTSNGITLDTVGGTVNLGTVNITNAAGSGLSMDNSTAAVTVGQLNVNGAVDGLLFGNNTGGSFTATGTTTLSNVTGSGINMQGANGTYNFADLNITSLGAFTGLDFRNSNVLFTSSNTTITGNGTAGSIGIDLSGSTNPNGANSTTSNIHLANGAGQTAIINNVDTGVLLGNVVDGSAGAYLVYGNQTALNSGSQINVTPSGVTLDTTNLTSTNGYTQGRYEFLGVAFTGIASFQKSNDLIFVGSTSSGTDDGSSPLNRISVTQLLALDATPSNLDGKTVVLVNDNGGVGINLGANTLTLGDNTILDSFGNGQTFSTNGVLPVNVIVDTISGNVVYSDPNGAATLTNNGSMNLVTLGNGDTVQNLILSGGTNTIFGSGIAGANINNNTITGASLAGISLTNTTGAIGITQNAISSTGTDGILLTNAGAVSVNGGTINGTGGDGIHSSDTNLTATNVNIGGTGTITGDGIEIVNGGSAHVVNLSNNTIKANASGISTVDSGNPGELVLTLDGNTLQSLNAGSKALSVLGGGPNSTIVASMNGGTVIGGANSGGVVFNRVTFDASGAALSGAQVTAGNWTIGTNGARVQGDGLRFDGPTGNLAFGNLNISNNVGTGLYVDTKSLGTTFALNNTGGSVDTTGGSALFLDPLTTNMTFGTVTSANSAGAGMTLDAVSGSLTIGTLNVSNSAGDGVYVHNSTGTFNINGGSITGALGDSFHVNGGSANVTYNGSITSSAGRVAFVNGTTGGSVTFGGLLSGEGPGEGIRVTSNAGNVTFNGDVSLGAATALSNEAVYLTNNTGNITFGNLDVNVNTVSALGAIYGINNSLVTIGGGNITSTGAAALNFDSSKIDFTLSGITASGGTDGLDLTNLASGSILNSTTTTITGVEQTGIKLLNSQGTYNFGTLDINGAKKGIDFRNSNLSFTSGNTTLTGDGSGSSVAIDLSGTQNPNGANSTTPNIQIANAAGQTAIINNFSTGIRMGNVPDGSAGAYFIYGNQTPLNSGSQINVIGGGLTLDATHLTSTDPYTQGRYEFKGVSFTGNTSFPIGGAQLLFVGSVSSGAATGTDPNNRMSLAQLLALDSTPSNLDNLTVVLVNDSGTGGGAANLNMAANTLTLGTNTILDSFGNGQTFTSSGPIVPVNVIVDTLGAVTYTDPFGNGAATLTNNGSLNLVTLGNNDTVQNVILSGGQDQVFGSGVSGVNVNHTTFNGLPGGSAIHLVNTTGTISLDSNSISNSGNSGILLSNAGTVSITGGTIDNTSLHGIESTNTDLTVDGVTFGGTLGLAGAGVSITNNDATNRTVNLTNLISSATSNIGLQGIVINSSGTGTLTANLSGNSIAATQSGLLVNETAAVAATDTVRLNLTGTNTWQSGTGVYAVDINGQNIDANNSSVVITSLGNGTITGNGTGGGVHFNNVGFDGDLGTVGNQQVAAGTWNIGQGTLAGQRVAGDGLRFDGSTGDLGFSTLNIYNNNGTGLYVDTKTVGTTFNLGTGAGSIDTTNGAAMFLDPLTTAMTLGSVTSTNASGDAVTFDTVGGIIAIGSLNISGASGSGLVIGNSSGLTSTFTTVDISNVGTLVEDNGITLSDAGTVNILGGTINGTTGNAILSQDTNLTATGLNIGGTGTISGDGIGIGNTGTGSTYTIDVSNNTIKSTGLAISSVDSGSAADLVLTLDGNTIQSTGSLAMNITGSGFNSTIIKSMSGGTVVGNGAGGGVLFQQVTFDASGAALTGAQVNAGDWTIGTNAARVQGDGLRFDAPTGDLAFGNLNVSNNNGTGLYVDTKTVGTTFNLANAGGTVDTTGGAALFLDPLSVNMTLASVTSDLSGDNGVWLDGLSGSFTVTGATTVTNAGLNGILIENSSGNINFGDVNIDTTGADGVHINNNTGTIDFNGTTTIQNTTGDGIDEASAGGGVNFGVTSISSAGANGINLSSATGSYNFGGTTINGFGTNKVGVNFVGASAAAAFGVTDIQNGGFGTGIDLSSTTGNKVITFATGSNISNVALGVELSSSHTTATTANANFSFGDGSLPTGSTINATTTVNAIGLDAASGTYDFVDVAFTGSASLPGGAGSALFVSATAVNGVGDGSFSNPYSVADADAVATTGAKFVFLDGTYDFNSLNGGQAFTLAKNQSVEGFDNGNTVIYGTVQPANISGNLGASGGIASRTGSLSITDSAANGIFDLAGGNSLLDITLTGSAATTYLVNANSATVGFDNTSGISLNGVTMSNPAGSATALQFTNLSGNVVVNGNNINLASGGLLDINGGTAVYTIARGTQPDAGSTPGVLLGGTMRIRNTTSGSVALNGMTLNSSATLVTLDNNDATFSFLNETISGGIGSTLFDIDTGTGGSTTALTFDASNSITQARGTIATIGAGARNIDLSLFDFNNINTTNANVISSVGQTGGTIKFGNIGISNYNNAAGTAVSLTGSGGTVQFTDLDITAANGAGLNVGGITFDPGVTPTILALNGNALTMSGTTIAGGSTTFDSVTSGGGAYGIQMASVTGTTTFTTVNIDNSTLDGIALSNAGTVFINGGTIDGTTDNGINGINTNLALSGLTIGGAAPIGARGIQIVNTASKTLAIDNTTVTNIQDIGIYVDGSPGGTTTVTSFNGNTVSKSGAGGVNFDTVTFDANTSTAGIQQVTGGNLSIGSLVTTTDVTGDGLVLNNVLGDIAFGTLNIGNDNGTGLYIRDAGGKGGSFAFSNTGGTINTTNGPAMDIDPVTMNSTFASVSSTNANGQGTSLLGNGINLNTITGSVTINTGSITGATGGSFVVDGGNAAIVYGGDITNTAGRLVSVANTTGGSVTFGAAGTLTDSGAGGNTGTGILLSNVAGNVSFNGSTALTNSDSTGVDIQGGSGTFTFGAGTTITSATGIDFNVNGGTSSVTYSGGMTQALNNVALVNVQGGHNTGTLTFQTGTLDATTGTGLQFNNADGTYNFNGTTTLHGGDAGVDIVNGSGGTFVFGSGTAITSPSGTAFNMDGSTAGVTFSGNITQANNASLIGISNETSGTVTFQTGTLSATNGNGIQLSNADNTVNFNGTTTLNGGDAGVDIVSGSAGSFTFGTGTTITSPTGTAFNMNGSAAGVTFSGNITQANNAALVAITNETGGTVTFQTGTLSATNGTGIQLSNADNTINFNGTTTLNGGDAGIDIVSGSSGTITFGTGTTVTNPIGLPYNEDTSTANVTFNGSITKTSSSNSAISINAKTGGTTSFNGLVTATTGATNAISLTSNSGGTMNFGNTTGTSAITTTSGNGFNFTGGGALNLSGNNYVVNSTSGTAFNATAGTVTATGTGNTITSTTGRAVNINGATIGGSGVTFRSVSANGGATSAILLSGTGAGNFTVTGDGTAAAGAQGGNASGGTIQNITGADAISLNNVSGTVSLKSMSILNITDSTDASDAKQTLSGVDAIQGTGTIGGLSLVGVKISNTSDMAINGVTGTSWNGLTIDNSLLEKSNRFGVSGKGDDNNEGMVQILGITGTASITNSKFDQGARLLDLQTGTSGNLNVTATNNTFSNSWKGFDSAGDGIYFIGGDAVRILTQGSTTATVIIGDQNQSNSALGNFFLNDKYSLNIGHMNSTDTGLIKTTISENNFQVTNHKSPTGSPLFNYPNGTVLLLGKGIGGLNANVSHNTFDQLTDNQGLFGSLNVAAENGTTQVRINNNTFIKPWDHSMHLRTNNSATLTAEINNNTYVTGSAGGAGTDSVSFNGPWDNIWIQSIGSSASTVNVTIHDEALPTNVNSANDLEFTTAAAGQTMNVFLYNLTAPKGYKFNASAAGGTINLYRNGSVAGTVAGILSDNNVTGGGGSTVTDPPTVSIPGAGTVQGTNTAPTLPSFTVP